MIILAFDSQRIRSIALDFIAKRADHLTVAGIAAFANIDVAPRLLQRCVKTHVRVNFDRVVDSKQRRDLDEAADTGCQYDPERQRH